jgi:hypothetical protein
MRRTLSGWPGLIVLSSFGAVAPLVLVLLFRTALPHELGPLKLVQSAWGKEAAAMVDRMHGKEVAQRENFIGLYRSERGAATVYLTAYPTDRLAEENYAVMERRIEAGNTPFDHLSHISVLGQDGAACIGQGQVHFFFAYNRNLYWLAADLPVAREALQRLIESTRQ